MYDFIRLFLGLSARSQQDHYSLVEEDKTHTGHTGMLTLLLILRVGPFSKTPLLGETFIWTLLELQCSGIRNHFTHFNHFVKGVDIVVYCLLAGP